MVSTISALEELGLGTVLEDGEHPRKLAILGLPWDTSEETLRAYFSQFGGIEHAEIMKDRYTGKSRGFGFVTFAETASATTALSSEHTIDGRRCEAKIALPKGEPSPPRTTRIFVARIPPSVTEVQFRSYFEGFGKLQDAYMPKDHSKQGYRGIGFVTFTSPDAVEKIMAVKHWMNGHEIAIDRATPKEEPSALKSMFARLPLQSGQRRSFDNGAGIIGPGLTSVMHINNMGAQHQPTLSNLAPGALDSAYNQLRSLSEDRDLSSIAVSRGLDLAELNGGGALNGQYHTNDQSGMAARLSMGMALQNGSAAAAAAAAAATTAALQTLAKAQQHQHQQQQQSGGMAVDNMGVNMNLQSQIAAQGLHNLTSNFGASIMANALSKGMRSSGTGMQGDIGTAAAVQQLMAAAAVQSGRRSLDAATAHLKRMENPAIANARAGPRIFIGKLSKETSEADVKDYFMRFGYVMDVYLPKAKDNKMEHRGFGFVTFETEAAIQRVVSNGTHRLKGSTIAIDIAMPKVEEESLLEGTMDHSTPGSFPAPLNMPSLGLMPQHI